MKKVQLLLLLLTALIGNARAQNEAMDIKLAPGHKCGFDYALRKLNYPYDDVIRYYKETVKAAGSVNAAAKTTGTVYNIPVVFHVIYSQATPTFNVPDSVLTNQIDVL